MKLTTLKLDEESELEFSLQIFGTTEKSSDIRFYIEGAEYSLSFTGIVENETVKVKIPKLKNIIPHGIYECRMEVIVGDKIFSPLKESIEIQQLVEINVVDVKVDTIKEKEEIKISPLTVSHSIDESKSVLDEVAEAGFEVEIFEGISLLKRDEKYFGYVNGNKITQRNSGFNTPEELVKVLRVKING